MTESAEALPGGVPAESAELMGGGRERQGRRPNAGRTEPLECW